MSGLPNKKDITEINYVQPIHQIIDEVQRLSDALGSADMALMGAVVELKQEVRAGFERLDKDVKGLREDTKEGFSNLESKFSGLESEMRQTKEDLTKEMRQTREETVDLLKQIAASVRK